MLICAALILAAQIISGWRQGPIRQINRLLAVVLAYVVAYFGCSRVAPLLRGYLGYPDFILTILAGAILGVATFLVLIALGRIIFRRTADQQSGLVRLGYGLSGAVMGMLFGVFTLWLLALGVKILGTVAEAQMPPRQATAHDEKRTAARNSDTAAHPGQPSALVATLASLKHSLVGSVPGSVLAAADPIPRQAYDVLGKIAHVVSDQRSMERFLEFPGAKTLAEHPNFLQLRDDSGVMELVRRKNYLALLHNANVVKMLNDPQFSAELRKFELTNALNYALEKNQPRTSAGPAEHD